MRKHTRSIVLKLTFLLAAFLFLGCETPGESGVLTFDDESVYPGKFAETIKVGVN